MGIGSAAVHAFDGSTWTDWPLPAGNDDQASTYGRVNLEILADGTVWANSGDVITRLDEGSWTAVESPMGQSSPMRASDTEIWVDGPPNGITDQDGTLYRFDGADWEAFETPEGYIGRGSLWGSAPVGADGTLWVSLHRSPPGGSGERPVIPTGIARFDGSGWEEWEAADFPDEGALDPVDGDWNFEGIGPDGSLWALPYECKGVGRFDGTTVTQYLAGRCVGAMDLGPDGSAWLVTVTQGGDPDGIYVIKPDDASTMEWPPDEDGRPRASEPMGIRPHR